jgi:hypothetical protein
VAGNMAVAASRSSCCLKEPFRAVPMWAAGAAPEGMRVAGLDARKRLGLLVSRSTWTPRLVRARPARGKLSARSMGPGGMVGVGNPAKLRSRAGHISSRIESHTKKFIHFLFATTV